jgi:hypothetical protein
MKQRLFRATGPSLLLLAATIVGWGIFSGLLGSLHFDKTSNDNQLNAPLSFDDGLLDDVHFYSIPGTLFETTAGRHLAGELILMLRALALPEKGRYIIRGYCIFQLANISEYGSIWPTIYFPRRDQRYILSGGRSYAPGALPRGLFRGRSALSRRIKSFLYIR